MTEEPTVGGPARSPADLRFGRHVRSCRRSRGLTQEVLAERSDLSIDTIRRLEKGSFSPSLDTLRKLCMGLQLEISTFFESLELGERTIPRELNHALADMTQEAQRALLEFVTERARKRGKR